MGYKRSLTDPINERGRTHLLEFGHHDDVQVLDEAVQIGDEQGFGTVLGEVNECSSCVGLNARVRLILHGLQERRDHLQKNRAMMNESGEICNDKSIL